MNLAQLESACTVEAVGEVVAAESRRIGFEFHAIVRHGALTKNRARSLLLHNYPSAWAQTYLERRLYRHDAAHRIANWRPGSFMWSEIETWAPLLPGEAAVMASARRAGLGEGFTVPLHAYGQPGASCTFVTAPGTDLPLQSLYAAEMLARAAFSRIETLKSRDGDPPVALLTPRERDCIGLLAQGKSDWEIAVVLGIAEDTVSGYLKSARRRFGVTRRAQLVVVALAHGLVSWDEVLGQ